MKKFNLKVEGKNYTVQIDVRNRSEREIENILDNMALEIMSNRF